MAKSEKPQVIEWIYDSLVDPSSGALTRTVVTSDDVLAGIDATGASLSKKNTANFMKDIIRGEGASGMWPDKLKALRIGGKQLTGDGNVFEFVEYEPDQVEAFPSRFGYHEDVPKHRLQSVSMPLGTKALGRDDETYLIQVAVKLSLVETHFALMSALNVVELTHLQVGIKLRLCEVDAMFSALILDGEGNLQRIIITAEAKKKRQRILEEQVVQQVHAAFKETDVDLIVPIAMTAAEDGVYVAEFEAVRRSDAPQFKHLILASEAWYELVPAVPGIAAVTRRRKQPGRPTAAV